MTRIFRDLHSNPGKPLILPNVWDAGGARIVESVGAKAVATTSAGVAWSKGYPDGNKMQPRLLAHLAGEIVKTVKVPVSIDFEAGYSDKPAVVVENLKPIVAAGISGINIEDGTDEPALLAKKIEAIKKMVSSEGVDVFVNARTDVYLQDLVADDKKVRETLDRAVTISASIPLFSESEMGEFRSQWSTIQTGFVDEPRRTVEGADKLVAAVMQRLAGRFCQRAVGIGKAVGQRVHRGSPACPAVLSLLF